MQKGIKFRIYPNKGQKAFLTHGKSPVIDEPAASQRLVDEGFLSFIRVDSEFDPFLHYPILSFCLCDVFL